MNTDNKVETVAGDQNAGLKPTAKSRAAWRAQQEELSPLRRLNREREYTLEAIRAGEESLKYNPYKEDHPGIERELAELRFDALEIDRDILEATTGV